MSRGVDGTPGPTPGTPTPAGAVDPLAGTTPISAPPGGGEEDDEDADSPDSLDDLLAKVAAAPDIPLGAAAPGVLDTGTLVDGSYRLDRKLGAGGMGLVFLAHDEELDRDVALKVHRGPIRDRDVQRLGREAKVMARLSHPNVVGVYQVGTHESMLYVAMEYVDGGTMRHWVERASPGWRELTQLCIEIGEGLVAAHSVGIVHRDLKPDNVLVGRDGRPRVADFGLARLWQGAPDRQAELEDGDGDDREPSALDRFTVTGAIVGTPAYMSPEQFAGLETGPAADQFSLCVLMYEALCGQRPFSGATSVELAESVMRGDVRPPPKGVDAPTELLDLVTIGLRPDPGERHESVEVLLRRLRQLLGRRRRRIIVGAGALGLSIAAVSGFSAASAITPSACDDLDDPLSAFYDDRRSAIADALGQAAPDVADRIVERLDAFAAAWTEQRVQACEATSIRKERSELELGLRMACLDRMAGRFDGLTAELATPGALPGLSVAVVTAMLPDLSACEDVDALEQLDNRFASRSARDSSEADRAYVEAQRLIEQANVRQRFGRENATSLAEDALSLATEHELVVPQLRAHLVLAEDAQDRGDLEAAAKHRRAAGALAAAAGDDAASVSVMLGRARQALAGGHLDLAEAHLQYVDEYLPRIADAQMHDERLHHSRLLRGELALHRGDQDRAIATIGPALKQLDPEDPSVINALDILAAAYDMAGRPEEATATYERLYAMKVERLGEGAVSLVGTLSNLALLDAENGRVETGLDRLRKAEAILEAAESPPVVERSNVQSNLGYVHRLAGNLKEARVHQEEALRQRTEAFSDDHPSLANSLDELGAIARIEGDYVTSLEHLERSLEIRDAAFGPRHARAAITLTHMGRTFIAQGRKDIAVQALTVALEIREASNADPVRWAETELELARALAGTEPERVEALKASARARVAGAGDRAKDVLDGFAAL